MNKLLLMVFCTIVNGLAAAISHADTIPMANHEVITEIYSPEAYKSREIHDSVIAMSSGEGSNRVYIFVPDQPALPNKLKVPVVFFHHGWLGMSPMNFGALIDHLVRTGHVVIYPVYQESASTSPQVVTANAVAADLDALEKLALDGLFPDPNRVMYIGYSMGAAITLNIAIKEDHWGLPSPKAIVLLAPGDAYHVAKGEDAKSIIGDVKALKGDIPIAVMSGAADTNIGVPTARKIYADLCGISPMHRVLMLLPSDSSGLKTVRSAHGSPGAPDSRYEFHLSDTNFPKEIKRLEHFEESASLNQLDFYGFWKIITEVNRGLAEGIKSPLIFGEESSHKLSLGNWPDGKPFREIQLENPCPL